jgi:hypothetical protein
MKAHMPEVVAMYQDPKYNLPLKAPTGVYKKPNSTEELFRAVEVHPAAKQAAHHMHLNRMWR